VLHADLDGRWLVTSKRSRHIWDLDAMTYERVPAGQDSQQFDYDREPHPITRVVAYPVVGESSHVIFDDPERPWLEQFRISSPIRSIKRLSGDDPGSRDASVVTNTEKNPPNAR
jgi:hypothetical protein